MKNPSFKINYIYDTHCYISMKFLEALHLTSPWLPKISVGISFSPQSLEGANELIGRLKEELAIRERLYQELRESKEKEVAELVKIKSDLEVKTPITVQLSAR